jgi:hypothetical protein
LQLQLYHLNRAAALFGAVFVGIGAPAARMGAQQRRRLAVVVVEAGEAASRRLGWTHETQDLREG